MPTPHYQKGGTMERKIEILPLAEEIRKAVITDLIERGHTPKPNEVYYQDGFYYFDISIKDADQKIEIF